VEIEVLRFEHPFLYLDGSIGRYLSSYLHQLGASTVIVEKHYVDRDFLIDYAKFYARSFSAPERFTKRLHFFSLEFTKTELEKALSGNQSAIKRLYTSYLGFIVLKPIKGADGGPLVGRTVLKTYPKKADSDTRTFLTHKCKACLYGIPLDVDTLPFQTQDMAVAACATTSLWISLHPLSALFQVPMLSPAEITERAVTFPGEERNFPSFGLNIGQMINFINSIGLDTENINVIREDNEVVPNAVRAYIAAGIPIIACLILSKGGKQCDYHAAVISGYRTDVNGKIKELYVHDDQIGPYSRVKSSEPSFRIWENEWIKYGGYGEVRVERLLVPIYPKIRLTFGRIYSVYLKERDKISAQGFGCNFFLTQVNQYKYFLLSRKLKDKPTILVEPLPRFIWVIRAYLNNEPILDILYDGTEVFPKKLLTVNFCA